MATISLTGDQITEVVKRELFTRMVDYAVGYPSGPDPDEVMNFYFVWRFYATPQDFRVLAEEFPDVQKVIDEF